MAKPCVNGSPTPPGEEGRGEPPTTLHLGNCVSRDRARLSKAISLARVEISPAAIVNKV